MYKFIARSKSDPNCDKGGLGFHTREQAEIHKEQMNDLIFKYDSEGIWNKDFWKTKPEQWEVYEIQG